ncbi:hypothetical protein I601_2538 [Nocardioides dokdonensis FR1436]|uniref:Putative Flp pilus-assembly TadG-like N-terminal domain-containing protein n=1 Tax=Nocardioides dokdonensis FR1436 TaxID=1300347 RepID=A0A1A9GL06_9ACTN|nr:pilus assembly protein TadG-related protein [Nocardioides dokdonensis]ANH38954.1 hypothetical protein I601_2538 [Nocardioides dokdonensis FR1436]
MALGKGGSRHERGAVAPFLAVTMTLLIVMAAFAVDLGMQRVARRDMQALADVIALDMVRHLDGRSHAVIKAANEWRSGLAESLSHNLQDNSSPGISVQQKQETLTATVAGSPLTVTVEMGQVNLLTGEFSPIDYPEIPNAVHVEASTSIDFAFAPGSGGAVRTANAMTEANTCFSVGSWVAGLSKEPETVVALLNPILGNSDLTAVGYQGLADANVSLLDLMSAPTINVGSIEGLASATDITLNDILLASAFVLRNEGDTASAELLDDLARTSVVGDIEIQFDRLVALTTASGGALDAELNVLDLVAGAASIANKTNFAGLVVALPGVPMKTETTIIEGPRQACGGSGAKASTGQIVVDVSGDVGTSVPALIPGTGAVTIGGYLTVHSEVGAATGTLGDVTCGPDLIPVEVQTDAVTASQSLILKIEANDLGIGSGIIPGVPGLVTLDLAASQSIGAAAPVALDEPEDLVWDIPKTDTYKTVKEISGGSLLGVPTLSAPTGIKISDLRLMGVPINNVPILGPPLKKQLERTVSDLVDVLLGSTGLVGTAVSGLASGVVAPVITATNDLVGDLSGALGLQLAGADVRVQPYAKCNAPVLRG